MKTIITVVLTIVLVVGFFILLEKLGMLEECKLVNKKSSLQHEISILKLEIEKQELQKQLGAEQ